MAYCLIVAEKPDQSHLYASTLLKNCSAKEGFFEGLLPDGSPGIVTALNGQIIDHVSPEAYDAKWGRPWRLNVLPFAPPGNQWRFEPTQPAVLNQVKALLDSATSIVNACDAGRQGELIFWSALRRLGWDYKKLKGTRLWVTDPSPDGIREAWEKRIKVNHTTYLKLLAAAFAQWKADYLYGINMSRYVTCTMPAYGSLGHPTYSVGRVKTPTLALVQDRITEVENFVTEPFYTLRCEFYAEKNNYFATVLAPETMRFHFDEDRFREYDAMRHIKILIASNVAEWAVYDSVDPGHEKAPPPFDTLHLLRVSSRILGWSARKTMRVAQRLYDKCGAISYPRTRSHEIPPGMKSKCEQVFQTIWDFFADHAYPKLHDIGSMDVFDGWYDDIKDDHHAIIPTGVIPPAIENGKVPDTYILWDLIARRFLTAMSLPAEVQHCKRILELEMPDVNLTIRARLVAEPVLVPNWLLVEDAVGNSGALRDPYAKRLLISFPATASHARLVQTHDRQGNTTPNDYYTEDTLLEAMDRESLGTPATQSDIISEALDDGFLERRPNGHLFTTGLGAFHLEWMQRCGATEALTPKLTADWEAYFGKLEKGERKLEDVDNFCTSVLAQVEQLGLSLQKLPRTRICTLCPDTYKIIEFVNDEKGPRYSFYGKYKDIVFPTTYASRPMSDAEWREVIIGERSGHGPFEFTSNKSGAKFKAKLRLVLSKKKFEFVFKKGGYKDSEVIPVARSP